jgi:hypothetical protein
MTEGAFSLPEPLAEGGRRTHSAIAAPHGLPMIDPIRKQAI